MGQKCSSVPEFIVVLVNISQGLFLQMLYLLSQGGVLSAGCNVAVLWEPLFWVSNFNHQRRKSELTDLVFSTALLLERSYIKKMSSLIL